MLRKQNDKTEANDEGQPTEEGLDLLDLRSAKLQLLCKSMICTRTIQLDISIFYTIHVQCSDYMFWLIIWPSNVVSPLHMYSVKLLVIKEE
jgi:hypothetical protein